MSFCHFVVVWGTSTNSYSYPLVVRHFSFCLHDLTFGTRNALSFLSLQCREKKEKESEPKLWPRGHIQPATIHQYTIVAHAHDCSSAGSPPSLICIADKARRAHIVMSLDWAHVRARDERKMGENNALASSEHACATQLAITTPLKRPSGTAAIRSAAVPFKWHCQT